MRRARIRRMMELACLGQLPARRWERLRAELLAHEGLRREYDAMAAALRCLEDRPVASGEQALVEGVLLGADPREPSASRALGRNVGLGVALTALAVVALALVVAPGWRSGSGFGALEGQRGPSDEQFAVRGSPLSPALGVMLVCGPPGAGSQALVDASPDGCGIGDVMTLAYRLPADGELDSGYVSAFGLAEDGRILYYAPTPTEPQALSVSSKQFAASEVSVRLSVNHEPGEVHVFAMVSRHPVSLGVLELAAHELASRAPDPDSPDWTLGLSFPTRSVLCSERDCLTAQFDLEIHP